MVKRKRRKTNVTPAEAQEILALYQSGTPVREIAPAYNLSEASVYRSVRRQSAAQDRTAPDNAPAAARWTNTDNGRTHMSAPKGSAVRPAEARRIIEMFDQGMPMMQIGRKMGRSGVTVGKVVRERARYDISPEERARKGITIPQNAQEARRDSLRLPAQRPNEVPKFQPQIADSQVTFEFAIALLEKATEIVRTLSTQQHPPELMQLIADTINAGVNLAVANKEAERLAAEREAEEEAERVRREANAPYPLGGYVKGAAEPPVPIHTTEITPLVNRYGGAIRRGTPDQEASLARQQP